MTDWPTLTNGGMVVSLVVLALLLMVRALPVDYSAMILRHLDGNKTNPHADNLAWGTQKENAADRERHGKTSRGSKHSAAIRSSNQAEGTRAFHQSQKEARNV